MKNRFNQWRTTLLDKDVKGAVVEKTVIIKMERRLLKAGFRQFCDKMKLARQESVADKKGKDSEYWLKYNSKKRLFKALKKFYMNFHAAKINFRRVYRNSDYRSKKAYFYMWKADYYSLRDEANDEKLKK